jgi:hypothetical protein
MRVKILLILSLCLLPLHPAPLLSQDLATEGAVDRAFLDSLVNAGIVRDTLLKTRDVTLSKDDALKYLQKWIQPHLWKNMRDPLRAALIQLVFEAAHPPVDSAVNFLEKYPFDSLAVPREQFYIWEPARIKIADLGTRNDSLRIASVSDTLSTDSLRRKSMISEGQLKQALKDTTIMVAIDSIREVSSTYSGFPFRYYRYPFQSDSIKAASRVLLDYLTIRDSMIVNITGISGRETPLWLNSRSDMMIRYWLKNDLGDSVTVWVGNPGRNLIGLYLEKGVVFRRPAMQGNISKARVDVQTLNRNKLLNIRKIMTKTQYWNFHTQSALALNQGYLSNWVKGGESSVSTSVDFTYYADYVNKPMLLSSGNFIRLKYGLIATGTDGPKKYKIMKNLDLLETNSKLNHKAFGRFDFSSILLFKTQVSKGYNYPNDSAAVSKFMNPAMLTLGLGLDYKPNKQTSVNFSPLSYKLTLVTDTAHIDQTLYGISKNRKALHEPGASLLIAHEFSPVKNMNIVNRLQLFTNYIHNPQNVDVDWEMILTANLNWFTDVRLNTHLIFDDDTRTPVYDSEKNPILGPDGLQKKTARVQFKEVLGLSLIFRF